MFCTTCNLEIPSNASFCPKCGKRLDEATAPPPAASGPAHVTGEAPSPAGSSTPAAGPAPVLWSGCYSTKAMLGWWILVGVLILAGVAASIFVPTPITWIIAAAVAAISVLWLLGAMAVKRISLSYELTTEQLIHREGLLKRVTNRIETIDIDDVTHEQTLIERLLGIGSILVISSDKTHPRLTLHGIDDVQRIADLIDNTSREQRRKRSAYVEQI